VYRVRVARSRSTYRFSRHGGFLGTQGGTLKRASTCKTTATQEGLTTFTGTCGSGSHCIMQSQRLATGRTPLHRWVSSQGKVLRPPNRLLSSGTEFSAFEFSQAVCKYPIKIFSLNSCRGQHDGKKRIAGWAVDGAMTMW